MIAATALAALLPLGAARAEGFRSDRIAVMVQGSGPDVVLIPGLTSSPEIWTETVAAVPGYRYHLVQVAGFAGTPVGGNGADGPVLDPLAEEIARYIAEARLDRPALIGHSMGGTLAMMVAARHPGAVSRLMVVDMIPFMGLMLGPPGTTVESLRPMADQMLAGLLAGDEAARRARIETNIGAMVKDEGRRAGPIRHGLLSDPTLSARALHDLILTDLRPELKAIEAPMTVLYVRGPNVPLTDEQMDAVYKAAFAEAPNAELRHIPDSYHFIMLDQPALFHAAVKGFLG